MITSMQKLILCSLLITVFFHLSPVYSQTEYEVIAVEYPPFTTLLEKDGGIAFRLLNKKRLILK